MWAQTQVGDDLTGATADDRFGAAIDASDDAATVAVGSPVSGLASVYDFDETTMDYERRSVLSGPGGSEFGASVAVTADGASVVVGAPSGNVGGGVAAGYVELFSLGQTGPGTTGYVSQGVIEGVEAAENAGTAVAIAVDNATGATFFALGAPLNSAGGTGAGAVRVYQRLSGSSTLQQLGNDITGGGAAFAAGSSVALSGEGDRVVVGSPGANGRDGRVEVYDYNAGTMTWQLVGSPIPGPARSSFGASVATSEDGSRIAVGAPFFNNMAATAAGLVRVYELTNGQWQQVGNDIFGEVADELSGVSVSLSNDGMALAVGAPGNDEVGTDAGQARLYTMSGSLWTAVGTDVNGDAANDELGEAVVLSGDRQRLLVGAPGAAADAGLVRTFDTPAALPVTLTIFTAATVGKVVSLNWATAQESGNDFFAIEHSTDASTWAQLGRVTGAGDALQTNNYDFIHDAPATGQNYYRLRQVDYDGSFSFSPIRSVQFDGTAVSNVLLFPNPSKDGRVTVKLPDLSTDAAATLRVYSAGGRLVAEQTGARASGEVTFNNLPRGTYYLDVSAAKEHYRRRFVVQ